MSKLVLGIDFGTAHVGLATAETELATPLLSLRNDESIYQRIGQIVSERRITQIVCGMPEGKLEREVNKFAQTLEQVVKIPVVLHPETLSTQEAIGYLRQNGAKRAKLQNDHMYAAALILEDYLEHSK